MKRSSLSTHFICLQSLGILVLSLHIRSSCGFLTKCILPSIIQNDKNHNCCLLIERTMTSSSTDTFVECVSRTASDALGRKVLLETTRGGGYSGGGGATTGALLDRQTNEKYFLKSARGGLDMLRAEYEGVKAMADTETIQVPTPIAFGQHENTRQGFALFEYLDFCGGGSQRELGVMLAKMHKKGISPNGMFGFHIDNTIGATPQPNGWEEDWPEFWDKHRLGHMLTLTGDAGFDAEKVKKLRQKTRELLSHRPEPCIVHGDLWGGNKGFCKKNGKVIPVIFDPATYYGDREVDVAMVSISYFSTLSLSFLHSDETQFLSLDKKTYVFGGFNSDFYNGYNSEWPLPTGHEKRRTVYNLYHILNHEVLFGGGYLSQARSMIDQILRY
jgi:fructosamine-3-kinase